MNKPTCDICGKTFRDKYVMEVHVDSVHKALKKECFCGAMISQRYFPLHMKNVHNNHPQQFDCPKCNLTFSTFGTFKKHQRFHEDKTHSCSICKKVYPNKGRFNRHLQNTHNTKKNQSVKCELCDSEFVSQASLRIHIRTMHNNEKFKCNQCDKAYTQNHNLKNHMKIAHTKEGIDFQCQSCSKSFKLKSYLEVHIKNAHNSGTSVKCVICGNILKNAASLTNHIRLSHSKDSRTKCSHCGNRYSAYTIQKHIETIHNRKEMKCEVCDKLFLHPDSFARHQKFAHIDKSWECDLCNMKFQWPTDVYKHKKVAHLGEIYECKTCNKAFSYQHNLNRHVKSHDPLPDLPQ